MEKRALPETAGANGRRLRRAGCCVRNDAITHLTFDCYGTLVNWEHGILAAMRPWLRRVGVQAPPDAVLRRFVAHEATIESQRWRSYRDVLRGVMRGIAADFQVALSGSEEWLLADSLSRWPPFADTIQALRRLSTRFSLAIISNTDDALFAVTQERLRIRFDHVITAEQVRSYKPDKAHFQMALRRLDVPVSGILHVAQSLYHDHVPAKALGFRTAWINRPSLLAGRGLAPRAMVTPDFVFSDLSGLVAALEKTKSQTKRGGFARFGGLCGR
ncbi:MAG: haloacid dehalogenase type II [Verrucomicrobia bacterium]|nr:MAG: haloacid dehalogenase type II [Verrucomicrobiota bacterium]